MTNPRQAIEQWCEQQGLTIEKAAAINYGIQLWISDGILSTPVTAYDKGTIVVQGNDSILKQKIVVAAQTLAGARQKPSLPAGSSRQQEKLSPELLAAAGEEHIGIDEAGKGDYFGPLVVAAALVKPGDAKWLTVLGVKDSKKLSDQQSCELAEQLKAALPHEIIAIMPQRYNSLYQEIGNLNKLLAWGHARALENLLARTGSRLAISDQFADKRLLEATLMRQGQDICLLQCHRAEQDSAVAVASILARAVFLKSLNGLRRKYAVNFAKGATHVLKPAQEFVSKYGRERLAEVAKVHFKTTARI